MKALIIGATGATGKDLVNILLRDPDYTEVTIFVRRSSGITHPKLHEILTDFDKLNEFADRITGDICFSCMGTTLKAAGSKDKQWHIDFEIPLAFAQIARKNQVRGMVLLSAYGANKKSKMFYSRMKGTLEEDTVALGFDPCIVFKPGMLLRRNTDRPAERFIAGALHFVNRLGIIRRFRPLPTELLAEKMAKAPKIFPTGTHSVELEKIFGF